MCKCVEYSEKMFNEEHPEQAFSPVMLALIRLERTANKDIGSVEDDCRQVEEMRSILAKLTVTHIDSDNYANYLFKRAEQLSAHLETYKKIIGKIEIGSEIEDNFVMISSKFVDYLQKKLEFKTIWIESLEVIELGKQTAEKKILTLAELKSIAYVAFEAKNYWDLSDLRSKCDQELALMNELMESCLFAGKRCKEFGSDLYDKLTELEACFQSVVKTTMTCINQMKRTPAVGCDSSQW